MKKTITLAIDFDDVVRDNFTKKPIKGVFRALKWLQSKEIVCIISTANKDMDEVKRWLKKHKINLPVTDKKVAATAYIDNRAIRFVSWDDVCNYF